MIKRTFLSLAVVCLATLPLSAESIRPAKRTVEKLAEGVYFIRHPYAYGDFFPHSNTLIVIGDREVLVVDSTFLPSIAAEDLAEVRRLTDKPVRYLINTHWHGDHNYGNGVYRDAFPKVSIVAHRDTRDWMEAKNLPRDERHARALAEAKRQLESGKHADGKELTADERAEIQKDFEQRSQALAEWRKSRVVLPDTVFDTELTVDLGNRTVKIMYIGRANTSGDAIVFLPKEKIVATGDMVVAPVPYLFSGYPAEMIETLDKLKALGASTIVPGHGPVLRDYKYIEQVQAMLRMAVTESRRVWDTFNGPIDEVKKALDFSRFRREMAGEDKPSQDVFDGSVTRMIEIAYNEARVR